MADVVAFPGTVDWSGETPLMSLKDTPEGPFVTLAVLFRIVLSPHGRGHVLVLLQSPQDANPPSNRANYCLHDNEKLARYLIADYLSHFDAYKGLPGLRDLTYRQLDSVGTSGDPTVTYNETIRSGDLTVSLTWSDLGKPFSFALPPEKSATGKHYMPSLFIGSGDATVKVNGRRLPGKPVPREFAGHSITTAMLVFSETWIRA